MGREPDTLDVESLHKQINKDYDDYLDSYKTALVENGVKAFIEGDLKAQKALDLKLKFNLVNKEALKYIKEYKKELDAGGSTIQGEFIPWLETKSTEERAAIGKILEEGYKAGKPTGVKERKKGGGYPKNSIAHDLQEYFNSRKSHAATVARTEIARIQVHGSVNRYAKQGIKKVMWLVFNPCPLCGQYARHVFELDKVPREVPAHPNCRCALAPVPDEVPTGPAPYQKVPEVFERNAKALPPQPQTQPRPEWQITNKHHGEADVSIYAPDTHHDGWRTWRTRYSEKELTQAEYDATDYYTGAGYQDFNEWLRKSSKGSDRYKFNYYSSNASDPDELIKEMKVYKKDLDGLIAKERIPEEVTLFRSPGRSFAEDLIKNGQAVEPGYSSTATTFDVATRFGKRGDDGFKNIMVLTGKTDQPGMYISTMEHEVLKPTNTKYKLLGIREADQVNLGGPGGGIYQKARFLFVRIVD